MNTQNETYMKNRREFLKVASLAGLAGATPLPETLHPYIEEEKFAHIRKQAQTKHTQRFNMSGYAAPKLETVRIGFVGVGHRGIGAVERMSKIEGVEIKGVADIIPEKAEAIKAKMRKVGQNPDTYTGSPDAWKKLCERDDIDLIYIATPWELHTPQAVFSMNHGKHVCVEVPAAKTLEECWQLVETSERTKKHCTMLENCCFDFFELLTLNLARNGFFGEIAHGEAGYIHDLREYLFAKNRFEGMWHLKEAALNNGNLYPTHGLGPICQVMNINRGDKLEYLVSLSNIDTSLNNIAAELASKDDFYKEFVNKPYLSNMNTTIIRTSKGYSITVQYSITSTRPYSRIQLLSGPKATSLKYPLPGRIATGHQDWLSAEEMKALEEKYQPEIVKKIGDVAKKVGGHGGMDFLMDWRIIDCLRNGLPLDHDVYDAALWSSITQLTVWSVANRSNSIEIPDFTCGSWKTNKPVMMSLQGGGTTGVSKKTDAR
jgi:hypothetical protein